VEQRAKRRLQPARRDDLAAHQPKLRGRDQRGRASGRATPALIAGDYHALHPHSEAYLAFLRRDDSTGQTCVVALNFSSEEQTAIFDLGARQSRLLFSSREREDQPLTLDRLSLAPFEILIAESQWRSSLARANSHSQ
jgi:hypothetical protein